MASRETANFKLNQWEPGDAVLREEFNGDNEKVDAALAGLTAGQLRAVTGSYVGTGEYGAAHPNTLTFPFQPKLVIISCNAGEHLEMGTVFIGGQAANAGMGAVSNSSTCLNLAVSWPKNGISWYTKDRYSGDQFNSKNCSYSYFAMG